MRRRLVRNAGEYLKVQQPVSVRSQREADLNRAGQITCTRTCLRRRYDYIKIRRYHLPPRSALLRHAAFLDSKRIPERRLNTHRLHSKGLKALPGVKFKSAAADTVLSRSIHPRRKSETRVSKLSSERYDNARGGSSSRA
jgi:hypothetical protein